MLRTIGTLLFCMLIALGMNHDVQSQKKGKGLQELIAKFPTPAKKDGKLAEVDKKATDAAVKQLLKNPEQSVAGLIDLLAQKENDVRIQHVLHAMVMDAGDKKNQQVRKVVAKALGRTLDSDLPKPVQKFVVRQLQLIGDESQVEPIGRLLAEKELTEPAAQALLAIKTNAADQFRAALPKVTGKKKAVVAQGLGVLKDKKAAKLLRQVLEDKDRDNRLTAAWALANLPDASSADRLLKLADSAKGYERNNLTNSCFLLAKNLLETGDKAGARQIYSHLQKTRTDKSERFVKKAAEKGLASIK